MLFEVHNVRQPETDIIRRWFTNTYFDLIVWYDKRKVITGFQLCYDKSYNEHAITWKIDEGFLHNKIDDGEFAGQAKATPILVPDGNFDKNAILERFKKESTGLDREIREFVSRKLIEFK
jgi:hypothetical protein